MMLRHLTWPLALVTYPLGTVPRCRIEAPPQGTHIFPDILYIVVLPSMLDSVGEQEARKSSTSFSLRRKSSIPLHMSSIEGPATHGTSMSLFNIPSLLGLASSAITTVVFPLFAWGIQRLAQLLKQFNVLESQFAEVRSDVETLKEANTQSNGKLLLLEEAISDISEIKADLKQLPRVVTLLEQYGQTISTSVPRNEVESRLRATEERLRLVEQDIRSGKQE